jgi:hypothetical protein
MWKAIDDLFLEKHRVPDVAAKIKDIGEILSPHQPFEKGATGDVKPPED